MEVELDEELQTQAVVEPQDDNQVQAAAKEVLNQNQKEDGGENANEEN